MNHTIELFYHYRCKGHYDSAWIVYPDLEEYLDSSNSHETAFPYWINEEWVGDPLVGFQTFLLMENLIFKLKRSSGTLKRSVQV